MTIWDLFAMAARRWLLTLSGALLTVLAMLWVAQIPPLYYVQVRVVLLPPASAQPNAYGYTSKSLISLAGVVARELRPPTEDAQSVSSNVTLVGEGIRKGFSVRQQNSGGQWQYRFDEPVLEVQAVGATPAEVRTAIATALKQVDSTLAGLQDEQDVSAVNRVRTTLNPTQPQFVKEKESRVRAIASTALAGLISTLTVVAGFDSTRSIFSRRTKSTLRTREKSAV